MRGSVPVIPERPRVCPEGGGGDAYRQEGDCNHGGSGVLLHHHCLLFGHVVLVLRGLVEREAGQVRFGGVADRHIAHKALLPYDGQSDVAGSSCANGKKNACKPVSKQLESCGLSNNEPFID